MQEQVKLIKRVEGEMTSDQILDVFNKQLEKLDSKYNEHLTKIDEKLDKVIELTTAIATLQERSVKHGSDLDELKFDIRQCQDSSNKATERVHTRIDELEKSVHTNHSESISRISSTELYSQKYVNRGIGAMIVIGIVIGIIQTSAVLYVRDIHDDMINLKTKIETVQIETAKHSQILESFIYNAGVRAKKE